MPQPAGFLQIVEPGGELPPKRFTGRNQCHDPAASIICGCWLLAGDHSFGNDPMPGIEQGGVALQHGATALWRIEQLRELMQFQAQHAADRGLSGHGNEAQLLPQAL